MSNADLIARLEAATGNERGLFLEAFAVCFPEPATKATSAFKVMSAVPKDFAPDAHSHWALLLSKFQCMLDAEAYESAARMLVPEGWRIDHMRQHLTPLPHCDIALICWGEVVSASARTEANAFAAASLKAQEQSQ